MRQKFLILLSILCISVELNAQEYYQQVLGYAKQQYEKAKSSPENRDALSYSWDAIHVIMTNLPEDPNAVSKYMESYSVVFPIMLFYVDRSFHTMALWKNVYGGSKKAVANGAISEETYEFLKDTNLLVCSELFRILQVNKIIKFLHGYDSIDEEYVYFIQGRAKFFLDMPCLFDLDKAGGRGHNFMVSWGLK